MRRTTPSVIPPKIYRHFAMVTVLLTMGIAMFADGENREAVAAESAPQAEPRPSGEATAPKPVNADRRPVRRSTHYRGGFDGFDTSFGAPMDRPGGSTGVSSTAVWSETAPSGYSERYLESLSVEERNLLLAGLAEEGLLSPQERERKTTALIAASQARSGGSENY